MIKAKELTKTFGSASVVNGVSFEVERGEIVGFLGPNGAGKTTTMRILTCYFPPTSGTATIAGFDVLESSLEVRKRIGYMPETVPLYHDMTVEGYLQFVAEAREVPARERRKRIQETMDECSLSDRAEQPIRELSRGYKQRVGLAQAIIGKPEVLFLDEPTVGLDPRQIVEIRSLIKRIGEKSTVILSTHILPEVSMLCNRVVIINGGKVRAIDTPSNLESHLQQKVLIDVEVGGGDPEQVLRALRETPGVVAVTAGNHVGSISSFAVESTKDAEVRPRLAQRIVGASWDLVTLNQRHLSLEDIFIQLTSREQLDDPGTPPAEAAQAAATREDA